MSKRLQILVDDEEFEAIHRAADRAGQTMSEWARDALRRARRQRGTGDVARKMAAVRAAATHAFPIGDIDQVLAEIEQGYLG